MKWKMLFAPVLMLCLSAPAFASSALFVGLSGVVDTQRQWVDMDSYTSKDLRATFAAATGSAKGLSFGVDLAFPVARANTPEDVEIRLSVRKALWSR